MQLFINGQEIPEPIEGWARFAHNNPQPRTSLVHHPALTAIRQDVRDLLTLLCEKVREDGFNHLAIVRCADQSSRAIR